MSNEKLKKTINDFKKNLKEALNETIKAEGDAGNVLDEEALKEISGGIQDSAIDPSNEGCTGTNCGVNL
jgi:hypothetical protein